MTGDVRVPIVEEEARVIKCAVETERVRVRTIAEEEDLVVRETVDREQIEVTRVTVNREVVAAPAIRTEGDMTIVPVLEERLIIEKRLFLVEELHLHRTVRTEAVELPATLRRTRLEVDREQIDNQEDH